VTVVVRRKRVCLPPRVSRLFIAFHASRDSKYNRDSLGSIPCSQRPKTPVLQTMSAGGQSVEKFLTSVLPVPVDGHAEDERFQRPLVTLTFAQSLDGKIAGKGGKQLILSGRESMLMTHWYDIDLDLRDIPIPYYCRGRMRTKHDAILVGIGTALSDDPQLNSTLRFSSIHLTNVGITRSPYTRARKTEPFTSTRDTRYGSAP
jgi:hypothetical protein